MPAIHREAWVKDMIGLVCESSNPSGHDASIGDKPSHCYVDNTDVVTVDTQTLGEAVVYHDPSHYNDPTLFSRVDPLDGAVPVYR